MTDYLCIKTNNEKAINYLLDKLENCSLPGFYFCKRKFKKYYNLILFYRGNSISSFFSFFSNSLSNCICDVFELSILKHIINLNYFYFSNMEQEIILKNCLEYLKNSTIDEVLTKKDSLYFASLEYIENNKKMILDGFINFRIQNYIKILDYIVDLSVNKYVIDREYNNFIELLKTYVDSNSSLTDTINLLYLNGSATLLDENFIPVKIDCESLNNKYLSDISFSLNDYSLNTLLTLLPKKLIIHILDEEDEFINTLKLIFCNKISFCSNCNLCIGAKYSKN